MKKLKKISMLILLICAPNLSTASGLTSWAVPTGIEVVWEGIIIYGAFGNPGGCGSDVGIIVQTGTTQYNFVRAAALSAYVSKKRMKFYIGTCLTPAGYTTNIGIAYPNRHIQIAD